MRRFLSLLLLPLLSQPVYAAGSTRGDANAAHHARKTWEQRFTDANQAHDGHLTREEAKTGYAAVGKHFDDIDADHKGYVTENDIRAWRAARKAAHHRTHTADSSQALNAERPGSAAQKPVTASATRTSATDTRPARLDHADQE